MSETTNNQTAARKINFQSVKPISPLELIKQVVDNINTQILSLDLELLNASQGDTSSIQELSLNVHEIVQKSIQAKAVIEEVTKDPTKLKTVNSKITRSADLLKKINKLLDSLGELEQELISGEFDYYRVISELLLDVQKQISYFDPYQAIPHIIQVRNKLNTIENELRRQIQWNFREIGQLNPSLGDNDDVKSTSTNSTSSSSSIIIESSIDINSLSQVSLVIDALGDMFRHDLLERFAQLQLIPYEKIFHVVGGGGGGGNNNNYSGLEFFDRRYAWFKKLLKVADDKVSSIFPAHWMLPFYLFQEFSRRTKKHIHDNLTLLENTPQAKNDPNTYVQSLLKALKSIITFEAEMKSSFEVYSHGLEIDPKLIQLIRGDAAAAVASSASNNNENNNSEDGRKSLGESQDNNEMSSNNSSDYNIVSSSNSMADAFDAFLGPYVQLERKELDALMTKIMAEETAFFSSNTNGNKPNNTNNNKTTESENENMLLKAGDPFISSRRMFEFIKKSLKRCTAYSTGQTYLALSREFRICLHNYAESLKFRCPSPEYTQPGKPLVYNVTVEMEEVLCRIIITGEYCIDTVPQLENMMKKHIRPSLVSEIDFTDQIDMFNDMVGFTIGILTQGITQRVYPIFKKMRDMNWNNANQNVIDESVYVKEAIGIFNDTIPRIRLAIPAIFFQSFCMKLVTSSLDSYLDNIWKLKRITQTGAGQLLLDLNGLKEYLMRMPNSRLPVSTNPLVISNPYKNLVNNRITQIQVILKLVCTDDDKMEEMFALLWPDGKPSDLENIIALKSRGGNNLLLAPVNVVGDHLKEHTEKLGNMVLGQKATGDIKSGLGGIKNNVKSSFGGFTNAFGEMSKALTGDLFSDGSGASGSSHHGGSNNNNTNHNTTVNNSVKRPVVSASVNSAVTATSGSGSSASATNNRPVTASASSAPITASSKPK